LQQQGIEPGGNAQLRKQIRRLARQEVRHALQEKDWQNILTSAPAAQTLEQLAGPGIAETPTFPRVPDLQGCTTNRQKIERIVEACRGQNSYWSNNPMFHFLRELGPDAKADLLDVLNQLCRDGTNFAGRLLLTDVVGPWLTADDQDVILANLKLPHPALAEHVMRLDLPEGGRISLDLIESFPQGQKLPVPLAEIALHYHEEQALTALLDSFNRGNGNAFLLQLLEERYPDLDLREPVRDLAGFAKSRTDRYNAMKLMLKWGMPEGLDTGAALLAEPDTAWRNAALSDLRHYLGLTGSSTEILDYLQQNRRNLTWNDQTGRFQLSRPGPE
jgi:hypothetical protein